MVQKKPPVPARASTTNHSAHLSTKLATSAASSALLTSAFSPSYLRLSLFASTILGLDAQRLRIHDTATARLRCEHTFEQGVSVNSLAWGSLSASDDRGGAKKKRKRIPATNGGGGGDVTAAVVAAATSRGSILLFSPSEGAVVGVLEGGHIGEVRQFVFSGEAEEGKGWSCGADGKLVEWDLRRKITLRTINLPDPSIHRIAYTPPTVLCASHTVYAIPYANPGMAPPATYTANTSTIHSLFSSPRDNTHFLSGADSDRFITVFSIAAHKSVGALVAESDVTTLALASDAAVLAAVTADGSVEMFRTPFEPVVVAAAADPAAPASRKRKPGITRRGDAKIRVVRPGSSERVSIADASLQGEDLVVAWAESGVNMQFETVRWRSAEDGRLVLSGLVELARSKAVGIGAGGGGGVAMNGAKDMGKVSVDQSRTVVVGGVETQDVGMVDATDASNDEEEQSDDNEEEADEEEDDDDDDDDEKEPEELSFAEKFQALEVSSAAKTATSTALTTIATTITTTTTALEKKSTHHPPSAGSLTTVLTQALKTNDTSLLESCLHTTDSPSILATVRRLKSTLAVSLLERLAERIARRPGRAGSLGVWVRWTLVAHGGYLVSLPDLMRTLSGLHSTLNTRAGALPRLLALQGRLDMLHAQVDLRKALRNSTEGGLEGADRGVLYVEGQEEQGSSSDDDDGGEEEGSDEEPEEVGMQGLLIEDASFIKGGAGGETETEDEDMVNGEGSSDEDEEDEDEDEDEDEESEDEDEDGGGFLDIEASEASAEEEENEVDYDDVDVEVLDTEEEEAEEEERAGSSKSKSKLLQGRNRR